METVTLKLPDQLLRDAARVAKGDDVTVGHLVRVLLAREVDRRLHPKASFPADSALVAALQALLARDIAEAQDWEDLETRLARHGYALRPAGAGLALIKTSTDTRLCKGSDIGFSYRSLVTRFRAPLPGHPHGTLGLTFPGLQPDEKPLDSAEKARLRRALTPVFRTSEDWETLTRRLARRSYVLRPMGTGLALYASPQGRHVCDTAIVGYRYSALVKKFGEPLPVHCDGVEEILPESAADEIELIEKEA